MRKIINYFVFNVLLQIVIYIEIIKYHQLVKKLLKIKLFLKIVLIMLLYIINNWLTSKRKISIAILIATNKYRCLMLTTSQTSKNKEIRTPINNYKVQKTRKKCKLEWTPRRPCRCNSASCWRQKLRWMSNSLINLIINSKIPKKVFS